MLTKRQLKYKLKNKQKETPQEVIVKSILIKNNIPFINQKIVNMENGFYILDFFIRKPYRIDLEIDGWQHLSSRIDYDVKRTLFLELDQGIKVLRFRNDEVASDSFETTLLDALEKNKIQNRKLTTKEEIFFNRKKKFLLGNDLWKSRLLK